MIPAAGCAVRYQDVYSSVLIRWPVSSLSGRGGRCQGLKYILISSRAMPQSLGARELPTPLMKAKGNVAQCFAQFVHRKSINHQINNRNLMCGLIGRLNDGCGNNMVRKRIRFYNDTFRKPCFYWRVRLVQCLNFSADISASNSLLLVFLETHKRTLAVQWGVSVTKDPLPPQGRGAKVTTSSAWT